MTVNSRDSTPDENEFVITMIRNHIFQIEHRYCLRIKRAREIVIAVVAETIGAIHF